MKNKQMKCPACRRVSTFTHWFEAVVQFTAPIELVEGEILTDYDNRYEEQIIEADDDPEIGVCDKCHKDVEIADIQIVRGNINRLRKGENL